MSPILVFAIAAQNPSPPPQSSLRPMLIVTRDPKAEDEQLAAGRSSSLPDPKAPGKWIVQDAIQTRARLLRERGLVVRDLGEFLLAAPSDLLGIPQAKREMALMREIARRSASGDRILAIKDLPREEANTLRSKLADYHEPHNERVKNAPYLRFGIATRGAFDVMSGNLRRTFQLLPGLTGDSSDRDTQKMTVMRPDIEDPAAGIAPSGPPLTAGLPDAEHVSEKPASKEKAAPAMTKGRLTFLVPPGFLVIKD